MNSAAYWIEKLGLQKHPEGGWFAEVYRSEGIIPASALSNHKGARSFSTSIYFLLEGKDFSAFHRIYSDEVWHFYAGCSVSIYSIDSEEKLGVYTIGDGDSFQVVIPAGEWFAAKPDDENSFSLVGCTVAPGFDFADFEIGKREELQKMYSPFNELIEELTRV